MSVEESIRCPNCGRSVVPRLWVIPSTVTSRTRVQHVCAFCGVVMYETGGGLHLSALVATIIVAVGMVLILILMFSLTRR